MSPAPDLTPETQLADLEKAVLDAVVSRGVLPDLTSLSDDLARLDPDEPRRSFAELRLLARAIDPAVPSLITPQSAPGRAGYSFVGQGDDARAWPAFAAALADGSALGEAARDLWAIDAGLWLSIGQKARRELARDWLSSPGRRLVQDLSLLEVLGGPKSEQNPDFSAVDMRWERLLDCAGAELRNGFGPEHARLHQTSPLRMPEWRPNWSPDAAAKPPDAAATANPGSADAATALFMLEQGTPALARAGALRWLLDQAVRAPVVTIAGIQRDIRQDLPVLLAMALDSNSPTAAETAHALEVEALCLAHAARIAQAMRQVDDVVGTWHIARWIQSATSRSPFYGGDNATLAVRLRVLLHEPASADAAPALAPARFGGLGIDIADFAWVAGAFCHYSGGPGLRPTPLPLVEKLRSIAHRTLRPGELAAEEALFREPADERPDWLFHVAPPLMARQLLSENLMVTWLASAPKDVVQELGEALSQHPERLEWLALAMLNEGEGLSTEMAAPFLVNWRQGALAKWEPPARAAFSVGLSALWQEVDLEPALAEIASAGEFAPDLLNRVAQRAEGRSEPLWAKAFEAATTALLGIAGDPAASIAARRSAIAFALRRAQGQDPSLLTKVLELAALPEFHAYISLQREIRRLGLREVGG